MKIEVKEKELIGNLAYDLKVLDDNATVADYLQALNYFIENDPIDRGRHYQTGKSSTCMGCNICCQERIPLTWIDVVKLSEKIPFEELFDKYIYIYAVGRAVDMTLKLNKDDVCKLNLPESGLCSHYEFRPLVCQTYICCKFFPAGDMLREIIVNTGEDQLVREWLRLIKEGELEFKIDEAEDLEIYEEDWPPTPFEGKKSYEEVKLKDLCPPSLWHKIKGFG